MKLALTAAVVALGLAAGTASAQYVVRGGGHQHQGHNHGVVVSPGFGGYGGFAQPSPGIGFGTSLYSPGFGNGYGSPGFGGSFYTPAPRRHLDFVPGHYDVHRGHLDYHPSHYHSHRFGPGPRH